MVAEKEPPIARKTYQYIIVVAAVLFMVLPFVSSFNELLTAIVMRIQLYTFIHDVVVPIEVKMVAAIIQYLFGIQTLVSSEYLHIQSAGRALTVYIAWNCVGWQSLVLFAFTLLTGLQGPFTRRSKTLCVILGAEGIFLLNLFRIVLVVLLAFYVGYLPAVVFHDYAGTILTLLYLVLFWFFSYNYVLERAPAADVSQQNGATGTAFARRNFATSRLCSCWRDSIVRSNVSSKLCIRALTISLVLQTWRE